MTCLSGTAKRTGLLGQLLLLLLASRLVGDLVSLANGTVPKWGAAEVAVLFTSAEDTRAVGCATHRVRPLVPTRSRQW